MSPPRQTTGRSRIPETVTELPTKAVIARSAATKQSRVPPRKDSGLLRSARN